MKKKRLKQKKENKLCFLDLQRMSFHGKISLLCSIQSEEHFSQDVIVKALHLWNTYSFLLQNELIYVFSLKYYELEN